TIDCTDIEDKETEITIHADRSDTICLSIRKFSETEIDYLYINTDYINSIIGCLQTILKTIKQ
ncbi:MAG TPA: hypothetical protein VMR76_00005, partial [Candidatus Saccharimonadia bacterium]|nr:hypothetical protein [Candidatus Saccharimonadia bacterium]